MADRVTIVPYNASWPSDFLKLGSRLRKALGSVALRIDHIGSTSVPGLAAKPIIDVQISVSDFEPMDAYGVPLEDCGFVHRMNNLDLTKRYFREKPGERRTHIHVRRIGSWPEQFALMFRDYMRTHEDDARYYAELKLELANQCGDDRIGYTEAKSPFIWSIMAKADKWAQETGWQPGRSDV